MTPHLIGTAEAARRIGVDRSTLTRLVDRGVIHAIRAHPGLRAPLMFDVLDVERLASERKKERAA